MSNVRMLNKPYFVHVDVIVSRGHKRSIENMNIVTDFLYHNLGVEFLTVEQVKTFCPAATIASIERFTSRRGITIDSNDAFAIIDYNKLVDAGENAVIGLWSLLNLFDDYWIALSVNGKKYLSLRNSDEYVLDDYDVKYPIIKGMYKRTHSVPSKKRLKTVIGEI